MAGGLPLECAGLGYGIEHATINATGCTPTNPPVGNEFAGTNVFDIANHTEGYVVGHAFGDIGASTERWF